MFGGLAEFYSKKVAATFASVTDADLQKQLTEADTAAAQAMEALKLTLVEELKKANDKFPLGAELYAQMVKQTERVDVPVDQIEAAGRADLERNTAALKSECDTYAPKASLQQCVAKVSANKPKGGAVEGARAELGMLKDFIVKNNVVSIPSSDEALVAEAPPYNRSNAAFIQIRRALRSRGGVGLQHCAAGSEVEQGRASSLHSQRGDAVVHVGARGVAGTFPAVPAFERRSVETRGHLGGICLRRGLGALRRRNDV